jgi:hypothetical protein
MPTQCLDARSANHRSHAYPQKAFRPGMLEWLQQRSGVQTQFWSVVFIGDSLLQVNQNCRGQGVDAVELSTNASGRVCWKSHPR